MWPKRRTLLRLGFRAGTAVGYFGDRELGHERRTALLGVAERVAGRSRVAPLLGWLDRLEAAAAPVDADPLPRGDAPGPAADASALSADGAALPADDAGPTAYDPLLPVDDPSADGTGPETAGLNADERIVVRALRAVEALTNHRVVQVDALERVEDGDDVEQGWAVTVALGTNGSDTTHGDTQTYRVVASSDGAVHVYTDVDVDET